MVFETSSTLSVFVGVGRQRDHSLASAEIQAGVCAQRWLFPSRVNAFTWGVKYQRCCVFPRWPWLWEWLAICSLKLIAIFSPSCWLQGVSDQGPNLHVSVIPISKWARALLYLKCELLTNPACTDSRMVMWGLVSPSGSATSSNKYQALPPSQRGAGQGLS